MGMVKEHKYGMTLVEALLVISLLLLAILAITPPMPSMKGNFHVHKFEDGYSGVMQKTFVGLDKVSCDPKRAKEDIFANSSASTQYCIKFADQLDSEFQHKPSSGYLQYFPVDNNKANFYGGLYWSAVHGIDFVAHPESSSLPNSTMAMFWKEKEM